MVVFLFVYLFFLFIFVLFFFFFGGGGGGAGGDPELKDLKTLGIRGLGLRDMCNPHPETSPQVLKIKDETPTLGLRQP